MLGKGKRKRWGFRFLKSFMIFELVLCEQCDHVVVHVELGFIIIRNYCKKKKKKSVSYLIFV